MPNSDIHFIVGGGTGLVNYAFRNKQLGREIDILEGVGVFLASGVAGLIPDLIDPATSPRHRSLGHSLAVSGLGLPTLWNKIQNNENLTINEKIFWQSVLLGFASHFCLDATTPASLPLLD